MTMQLFYAPMKKETRTVLQIRLSPELKAQAEQVALERDTSLSELMRGYLRRITRESRLNNQSSEGWAKTNERR